MLTDGFSDTLSSKSVQGTIEVRDLQPMELQMGLTFTDEDDERTAFWANVFFDAGRGIESCN